MNVFKHIIQLPVSQLLHSADVVRNTHTVVCDIVNLVLQEFVDNSNAKIETMKKKKKVHRDAADAGETQHMTAA